MSVEYLLESPAQSPIATLVLAHGAGAPMASMVAHLQPMTTPTLIVQGTRDPMGSPDEVAGYSLGRPVEMHWLGEGDHDFSTLKRSGVDQSQLMTGAADAVVAFVARYGARYSSLK